MSFIPHTPEETQEMLDVIGVQQIEELFDEIPQSIRIDGFDKIPTALTEMELTRLMQARSAQDKVYLNFIGAGAYEHHIPAAVWELASRGEFLTAYTPYQAEASQGTLQLLYEFQTMIANLMAMEVSNASLYDGASALAEAILMAVRLQKKSETRKILIAGTLNPNYARVAKSLVSNQEIILETIPVNFSTGTIDFAVLEKLSVEDVAAIVIPQPNFFGNLEDVNRLSDWAHQKNSLVIAVVNPLAMSILKPPGEWGNAAYNGADIACGELQPFGMPLASGGPYAGFICCKQDFVRQMPGRIIGCTEDLQGKRGFALTLQAREQHIRRAKATSNICTNQGLLVTAATIYLSLMGAEGLARVAQHSHANTRKLKELLLASSAVEAVFDTPFFHEIVLRFKQPIAKVTAHLAQQGIQAGYDLTSEFPELDNCLLMCVTETKTEADLKSFLTALAGVI